MKTQKKGGKGQAVHFSSGGELNLPLEEIGENYTVSFYIKPEKQLVGDLFVSKNARVFADEQGLKYTRDGYVYSLDKQIIVNQWSMIAFTADKNGLKFFVNGKLVKDMCVEEVVLPYKNRKKENENVKCLKIKTLVFALKRISVENATLDELKIYNQTLTDQEVWSLYQK